MYKWNSESRVITNYDTTDYTRQRSTYDHIRESYERDLHRWRISCYNENVPRDLAGIVATESALPQRELPCIEERFDFSLVLYLRHHVAVAYHIVS